jgi:probable HAF family extracellular repeat protein
MSQRHTIGAIVTGVCALARVASASCSGYTVEIFSNPDCSLLPSFATAWGIAENGAISGGWTDCGEVGHPGIWWPDGSFTELPLSADGGIPDSPFALNSAGQVAGRMHVPGLNPPDRAFLYSDGVTSNLGALPGHNTAAAHAISYAGIVVGTSNNNAVADQLRGFVWQNGKMSVLSPTYGSDSEAHGISDSGKVCGRMGNHPSLDSRAYVHDLTTGITADLGVLLDGATASHAIGINTFGNVCGVSRIITIPAWRGFMWSSGEAQDLGILPGKTHTRPQAINDSNVVVGFCDPGATAFVWRNGTITALNDLIPPELNLNFRLAWDINNAGQIVGQAEVIGTSDDVAVRLTPIPSPIGDSDCDGDIDTDDLLGVINNWADESPQGSNALPPCDFDHDSIVELDDLMIVIDNWTGNQS